MNRLDELAAIRVKRQSLIADLAALDAQRDRLIAECFTERDAGATKLARITGLTTTTIYAIRNRGGRPPTMERYQR